MYGAHGDGLQGKIEDARHRLGGLRGIRLTQLKKAADEVLHDHSHWRNRSKEAQRLVLQFLEMLKVVIEDSDAEKKA